jgi:hypothetical protein
MAIVRESAAKPSRVPALLFATLPGMLEVIARLSIGACDDSTLSMGIATAFCCTPGVI